MAAWQNVKVGDFLFERKGKYKPDAPEIADLKRIEKIDFSGRFHVAAKPSKTGMIRIEPGDLVISGINVAKGALGVYEGDRPVTATIHYSSYSFDKDKINVGYFKRFLKSPLLMRLLKEQVKGGIKTEVKPKHLLPLVIPLPDIKEQEKILSCFLKIESEDKALKEELTHQQTLLKKLRQQLLQEAIEGKLTIAWRSANPSAEPAAALLARIKAEKAKLTKAKKIKQQKPLPPINEKEKPFALPKGWAWCRLGEIILMHYGKALPKSQTKPVGEYPVYGSNGVVGFHSSRLTDKRSIIVGRKGSAGALQIAEGGSWTTDVAYYIEESHLFGFAYLTYLLKSLNLSQLGKGIKPGLNRDEVYSQLIPLAPLQEQQTIVAKAEKLLALCDKLQTQITQNQTHADALMQAVLREAFAHETNKALDKAL